MKKIIPTLLISLLLFSSCDVNADSSHSIIEKESILKAETSELIEEDTADLLNHSEILELKAQGEIIILPLIRAISLPYDKNQIRILDDLENWEIKNFILLNAFYTDNPDYIYHDYIIYIDRDCNPYQFLLKNIEKMVYQVFGTMNWDGLANANLDWNEIDSKYETGLEFEVGRMIQTKNISSTYNLNTNQIEVSVSMSYFGVEVNGDPDWSPFNHYTIIFEVMSQNGENYLQFVSIKEDN